MSDFCPIDSQRARLREWLRFIENERGLICVEGEAYRSPRDPDVLTDWLWVENSLTKPTLEEKIRDFAKSAHWGKLTRVEHFHLMLRFDLARVVSEEIFNGGRLEGLEYNSCWPSNFDDQSEMISWLLIEVWNVFGEVCLARWADWFLKETFINEET